MGCTGTADCTCGCCSGIAVETPQCVSNLPGLSELSYRSGTWSTFKQSMLARLSSADYPALQALTTRSDDDFTIAFLDATATMLDILTFYQERLANESYLRTATQLRSLSELARLVGYRPTPGAAAATYLAFSLRQTPGQAPDPGVAPTTIPQGTKVQSVPAQGQTPQTFETSADIAAKPDWNALPVQTGRSWNPANARRIYLSGTSTQLQQGDSLLILGTEREHYSGSGQPSEQWEVVVLDRVATDNVRNVTFVAWDKPLTHGSQHSSDPSRWTQVKVFAFRQKAALFGHNSPSPYLFVDPSHRDTPGLPLLIKVDDNGNWEWKKFKILDSNHIDLDATYPKIVVGSWFILTEEGIAQLYGVKEAITTSRADYALSVKVSELSADFADRGISAFQLRTTAVWAQSEQLDIAEEPLPYPLYGAIVPLAGVRTDLAGLQGIAVFGTRQKIAVRDGVTSLQIAGGAMLQPGDVLTLTAPPSPSLIAVDGTIRDWRHSATPVTLFVEDAEGRPGAVQARLDDFVLMPSGKKDPVVSEYAQVVSIDNTSDPAHTWLHLQAPLTFCYDRNTTTVNANVGLATHGQSVTEILGNGDPTTPNQTFTLKQHPLTYVQAPTPTGSASTLQVRVGNVEWSEKATLYGQGPSASVYTADYQSDGTTDVVLGDGVEGALLPTGQSNVQANYRVGSGAAGNVAAGALTSLIDRPLGVSGVTNPQPASGGQDPQSVDDTRTAAPLAVLTLGRVVSIVDYENFTGSFPGIAKAHALWIPYGPGYGVFLTVAGVGGAALSDGDPTLDNLITALGANGNPLTPITVQSYIETLFRFTARLRYDPAYDPKQVEAQVRAALSQSFGFAARAFDQAVGIDEIAAVIQGVAGVVAVNVTDLEREISSTGGDLGSLGKYATVSLLNEWLARRTTVERPFPDTPARLCASLPIADPHSLPQPAEILVLDPDPAKIVLGAMS
jgi:Baseplate J-like protein